MIVSSVPFVLLSRLLIEVACGEVVLSNSKRSNQTPPHPFWHISTFGSPKSTSISSDGQAGHFMLSQTCYEIFIVGIMGPFVRRKNKTFYVLKYLSICAGLSASERSISNCCSLNSRTLQGFLLSVGAWFKATARSARVLKA